MNPEADKRLKRLEKALGREGIEFRPESYKWSIVQVRPPGLQSLSPLIERCMVFMAVPTKLYSNLWLSRQASLPRQDCSPSLFQTSRPSLAEGLGRQPHCSL